MQEADDVCAFMKWRVHEPLHHSPQGLVALVLFLHAVAGMIDAFVYHSARALQKKIELGKHS